MKLKQTISDLEQVDEPFRQLYVKNDDGSYDLDLGEDDEKAQLRAKVDEFRTNNRKLFKQVEDLNARVSALGDLDPDEIKDLLKSKKQLEEQKEKELLDAGQVEEVIAKRTEAMRRDYEKQVSNLKSELETATISHKRLTEQLSVHVIDGRLQSAVQEVGRPRPGAMTDILSRGRTVWKIDEHGNPVPKDPEGDIIRGKKGDPLSPKEWAEKLLEEAPFLFEPSGGGGGGQNNKGSDTPEGNRRLITANDPMEFGRNAEAIAKGEVNVR